MAYGKVIQIIGPVIDCEFAKGEIPKINEAIRIMRNAPVVSLMMSLGSRSRMLSRVIMMYTAKSFSRGAPAS